MNTRQAKKVLRSSRYHPEPRLQKAAARWRKRSRRVAWGCWREPDALLFMSRTKAGGLIGGAMVRLDGHSARMKVVLRDGHVGRLVVVGSKWQMWRQPWVLVAEGESLDAVLGQVGEL